MYGPIKSNQSNSHSALAQLMREASYSMDPRVPRARALKLQRSKLLSWNDPGPTRLLQSFVSYRPCLRWPRAFGVPQ